MSQRKAKMQRRVEEARRSLPQAITSLESVTRELEEHRKALSSVHVLLKELEVKQFIMNARQDAMIETIDLLESKGLITGEEIERITRKFAEKIQAVLKEEPKNE